MMKRYNLLLIAVFAIVITQPVSAQLKPGDLAPNAKVIDATEMLPFNNGAAIIKKGSETALIDKEGNLVAPYHKYNLSSPADFGRVGLFRAVEGYITTSGKIIADMSWGVTRDGKLLIKSNPTDKSATYMDVSGKTYFLKGPLSGDAYQPLLEFSEECGQILNRTTNKIGFKNLKGEWICQPIYDWARPFSDGIAIVGKRDAFGEMKYGYINKTGKEIFPVVLSNTPGNFYAGVARIEPKDKNEFDHAFIDKEGKIILKITKDMKRISGDFPFMPMGNQLLYSAATKSIMNSKAEIKSEVDFLNDLGVKLRPGFDKGVFLYPNHGMIQGEITDDRKIRFRRVLAVQNFNSIVIGFVDLDSKKIVEAVFKDIWPFDPVCRLAYATLNLGKDKLGNYIYREGFINEQGIFVIVKGEASKW
ncbi:hypothetical protein BH11BAC5_BH11BAC5_09850 [soil metagenome]